MLEEDLTNLHLDKIEPYDLHPIPNLSRRHHALLVSFKNWKNGPKTRFLHQKFPFLHQKFCFFDTNIFIFYTKIFVFLHRFFTPNFVFLDQFFTTSLQQSFVELKVKNNYLSKVGVKNEKKNIGVKKRKVRSSKMYNIIILTIIATNLLITLITNCNKNTTFTFSTFDETN